MPRLVEVLQPLAPLLPPLLQPPLTRQLWTPPRQRCWVALLPAGALLMLLRPLS
jgi:hypothetical protein